MVRVCHISDIHFGRTFRFDIWSKVREEIKGFNPNIIIASGDFVDSPDPLLLLAAKCELQDLAAQCGANTQFFVVPGNHDLLDLGNIWHPGSAWWFERVMFCDTTDIRSNLESGLDFKLGLNEQTWRWARFPKIDRINPRNWVWKNKCDGRLQSCDYRRRGKRWPTRNIHDQVLILCLDSNSSAMREFVFATGRVGKNQVGRIDTPSTPPHCPCCGSLPAVAAEDGAVLLRIAVLHHHPLPIAARNRTSDEQVKEARLEPFLILKNGGDLIHELQRLKFDIILHGHKHRPQFARVELRADDPEGYPLLVLAGGSTAKRDERPSDNTLRTIQTETNGRLNVQTFEEGELKVERIYRESLDDLKRRAFIRAMERSGISAKELYSEVDIDGVGHLRSLDRTTELRIRKRGTTLDGMVSHVSLPPHDKRLDVHLEAEDERVGLFWRDDAKKRYVLGDPAIPANGYYWLHFNEPLRADSKALTFGIREAAANSIAMSKWEISERAKHKGGPVGLDDGYEQVGISVSYAVEGLVLRLKLPEELDHITPELRCRRHPASPNFPLRYLVEQRPSPHDPEYLLDPELMKEESGQLRYEAGPRTWILKVHRPIPGNIYSLRWPVPDPRIDRTVVYRTTAFQELLATLAPDGTTAINHQCQRLFDELAQKLMRRFRSDVSPHQRQTAFLMVYHSKDLCLRPVLIRSSTGSLPAGSFEVPLGGGVAGAAFLQRRILAWTSDPKSQSLIKPVSSGVLDSQWVLALPIFHQQRDDSGKPRLDIQPGAVIGVVTLGSDRLTSRISECAKEDDTAKEIGQEAQEFAQQCVFDILRLLSQPPAGDLASAAGSTPEA